LAKAETATVMVPAAEAEAEAGMAAVVEDTPVLAAVLRMSMRQAT
jgi:hypothetical protein